MGFGSITALLLLASSTGALAAPQEAEAPAAPGVSTRFLLEARVIELHDDGTERQAGAAAAPLLAREPSGLFVWWGRLDQADRVVVAEAGGKEGPDPELGSVGWLAVWEVQAKVLPGKGLWTVIAVLGKSRFDGRDEEGRPFYRRGVEKLRYADDEGEWRRREMASLEKIDAAESLGIATVVIEFRVIPAESPAAGL